MTEKKKDIMMKGTNGRGPHRPMVAQIGTTGRNIESAGWSVSFDLLHCR